MERLGKRSRQLSLSAKTRYQHGRRAETESKVGLASSRCDGHRSTDDHRKAIVCHHRSRPTVQFECTDRLYVLVDQSGCKFALGNNCCGVACRWESEIRTLLWRPQ